MNTSKLDESGRFVLANYQQQRPFSSFLPGIAGPLGIPLWVFYVNRGQAIASFGVESKDFPIMEFQPANKAYQTTPFTGFRTFLKLKRGDSPWRPYEPFSPRYRGEADLQNLVMGANELKLEEASFKYGLQTQVTYFILPGENFAGLARIVTVKNIGSDPASLEILDGLPVLIPYGVNNYLLKELGRTVEAWMEVFNLEARIPFYRVRASIVDRVEVETYQAGHFALGFVEQGGKSQSLPVLVDPAVVFGAETTFSSPDPFNQEPLTALLEKEQITCGRTPCGLFAHQSTLAVGEGMTIYSLYGHTSGLEILQPDLLRLTQASYFITKRQEAVSLASDLTSVIDTHTASPIFDAYCRQTFLDNVLRGGWPVLFGDPKKSPIYHIYSRKHGDIERDYNAFLIAPEPLSQGEGSYRDVNQNRRNDVLFNPEVGDFNIFTFMSLIQTDGYNPRTVRGSTFTLALEHQPAVLALTRQPEKLKTYLQKPFTPGKLLKFIDDHALELSVSREEFLSAVLGAAEQHLEAVFFEGYWIDHWEYNLDLIESFLAVYPDRQAELLFGRADLPFFDSPAVVQPRATKYVLARGVPRQIGSLLEDREKEALIASRAEQPNWTRKEYGHGDIYRTTLFAKLVLTALIKFATLDPWGMGIEMEAGRPGWYDALNGLPALFGSGMAETFELQRWLNFLQEVIRLNRDAILRLPVEAVDLLHSIATHLEVYDASTSSERDYDYWDSVSTARETYRQRTRLGFEGVEKLVSMSDLSRFLEAFQNKVSVGIARALELNGGFPPTYFMAHVDDYDVLAETNPQGYPYIRPKHFTPQVLPPFLEGPVRAYKILPGIEDARRLYRLVKTSSLYDRKLKMYKVNASLESLPFDIGRARAFPPGWLENKSIWLHMEYKYLFEVLKAGLYDEFFEDMQNTMVPFLDPQIYGRSTLENSSFLVSSAFPDETLHGAGFVARLSGSTAEFLSIWSLMMIGEKPFFMQNGELCLYLRPALPGWLFPLKGELSFCFLGHCMVTYHNLQRRDIFGDSVLAQRMSLTTEAGQRIDIAGNLLSSPYAAMVRTGQVKRLDVYF